MAECGKIRDGTGKTYPFDKLPRQAGAGRAGSQGLKSVCENQDLRTSPEGTAELSPGLLWEATGGGLVVSSAPWEKLEASLKR